MYNQVGTCSTLPSTLICYHQLSYALINSHALPSTPMHWLPCALINFHALSSTLVRSHQLSCSLIDSCVRSQLSCIPIHSHGHSGALIDCCAFSSILIGSHQLSDTLLNSSALPLTPVCSHLISSVIIDSHARVVWKFCAHLCKWHFSTFAFSFNIVILLFLSSFTIAKIISPFHRNSKHLNLH